MTATIGDKVYIGIDASLTGSGFGKIVGGNIELKTFKTKPADFPNDLDRVIYIVKEVCDRIPDKTSLVCLEDYYVAQSAAQMGSSIQLIQLGTTLRLTLYNRRIPFVIVAPSTLKKWVTSKGNIKKNMMLKEVFQRFNLNCQDDNQADGAGLAYLAQHIDRIVNKEPCSTYPAFQKEVAERLIKEGKKYNCNF